MGKCDLMWHDEREAAAPMFGQGMVCTKRTPTSDSFPAAGENKKISISWSSEILSLFPLAGVMDDFIAFRLFSKQENGGPVPSCPPLIFLVQFHLERICLVLGEGVARTPDNLANCRCQESLIFGFSVRNQISIFCPERLSKTTT